MKIFVVLLIFVCAKAQDIPPDTGPPPPPTTTDGPQPPPPDEPTPEEPPSIPPTPGTPPTPTTTVLPQPPPDEPPPDEPPPDEPTTPPPEVPTTPPPEVPTTPPPEVPTTPPPEEPTTPPPVVPTTPPPEEPTTPPPVVPTTPPPEEPTTPPPVVPTTPPPEEPTTPQPPTAGPTVTTASPTGTGPCPPVCPPRQRKKIVIRRIKKNKVVKKVRRKPDKEIGNFKLLPSSGFNSTVEAKLKDEPAEKTQVRSKRIKISKKFLKNLMKTQKQRATAARNEIQSLRPAKQTNTKRRREDVEPEKIDPQNVKGSHDHRTNKNQFSKGKRRYHLSRLQMHKIRKRLKGKCFHSKFEC